MSHLDRLQKSVSANEGFRASPYRDTRGLWTFAIGRCLETNPLTAAEWKYLLDQRALSVNITVDGADWLMLRDIAVAERDCVRAFDFFPKLDDARQNVLIEMVYQMGLMKVQRFVKMLAAIRAERWAEAESEGLNSKWAQADSPGRAGKLMKQLRTGEFV